MGRHRVAFNQKSDKDSTERTLATWTTVTKNGDPERSIRLVPITNDDEFGWEAQAVIGVDQVVDSSGAGVESHDLALYFLAENLSDKDRWPHGWPDGTSDPA
jgi:hypothetical protein